MPKFISVLSGAALALGLLASQALAENSTFDFYVSGIPVGKMSLSTSETKSSYSARSRIEASGFIGMLLTFYYDGESKGAITRQGAIVPALFEAHSKTPRTDRRTRIDWKNGTPVSVNVNPARDNAPDPAKQTGTIDPISAGFAILRDLPQDQLCDKTLMVFDGSRLSRLRLDPAKDGGGTFTCVGKYARVEGEAHTLSDQREFPFELVFSKQSGGVGRLEQIQTDTSFGRAVLRRRS